MTQTTLPPTASVAHMGEDGRMIAPSAARNAPVLCQVLRDVAPKQGRALELASGTGQHVIAFARTCPGLTWVPTDIDDTRLASIQAHVQLEQLTNLTLPLPLDATKSGWSATTGPIDLIVLVNLLHLISTDAAKTVIAEIAKALAPGGTALIYGPFMRGGELTSQGDESFHSELIAADPDIGYKDDFDVIDWAHSHGLETSHVLEMPANNLAFVFTRGT